MAGRRIAMATFAACLCGMPVHAQEVLGLRPTLDSGMAAKALKLPKVTRLTVAPEEPAPVPRKKRVPVQAFEAQPIGPQVFHYSPSLAIDAIYSTNPAHASKGGKDDVGIRLRPSLRFESDWVRHAWSGDVTGSFLKYANHDGLATTSLDASTRARLDILRTTRADVDLRYVLSQDGVEKTDVPASAAEARTDHTLSAGFALTRDFGGVEGRIRAGSTLQLYEDVKLVGGGKEKNADRDYVEPSVSLRATYTDPPAFKPFVEVAYTPRLHLKTLDRNGLDRDSSGVTASLGVAIDDGAVWSGELAAIYTVRDYADPALKTADTFGVNGNLTWKPTEITTATLSASSSLNETSSATNSAFPSWTVRAKVDHALRDNVDVSAGAGVTFEKQSNGTDATYEANLGAEWKMNPWLTWTAGYNALWLDSATPGGNYDEHRVSAGIVLRP
jgi:hypothetical protein